MTPYMWNVPRGRDMWIVPEPREIATIEVTGGARITVRRHGKPDGPRLILSHANGLAADLYYPFWSLLLGRFDLMLYDLRSHGWNRPAGLRHQNIPTFAADQELVRRGIELHFGLKPAVGVFHSLSALAALHHDPPGRGYAALVLFDPPLYPPSGDPYETEVMLRRFRTLALFRRSRFGTRASFAEHFRRMWTHDLVVPGLPELASRTLLRPSIERVATGEYHGRASVERGYELRCPPAMEARALESAFAYCLEPDAARLACPVKVIGGDPRLEFTFMPSTDVERLHAFGYEFVSETTHFLPLENPVRCARRMVAFLEARGLAGFAAGGEHRKNGHRKGEHDEAHRAGGDAACFKGSTSAIAISSST